MKSTPKKILSLFMSLLMLLSVTSGLTFTSFADNANADVSFEYTENDDGTINITGFTAGEDSTGNLDIPSKIDGKTVTGIENWVLYGDYESVTIPETVTSELSSYTFGYLDELKNISVNKNNSAYLSVDDALLNKDKTILICCPRGRKGVFAIPDGVKHLGDNAFNGCTLLTEISVPASLEKSYYDEPYIYYISGYDFFDCSSLERITVDEKNKDFASSAGGELLNKDKTELICCPKTKAGTYSIPEGIVRLDNNTFGSCDLITEIVIPSSLTDITYTYGALDGYAFSRCDNLEKITVDANNEYFSSVDGVLYSKDKSVLIACPINKDSIVILDSAREIGANAFISNDELKDIKIPDTVTKIGEEAFRSCGNLSQISLPSGIISIGDNAFSYTSYYNDENNWENGCLYLDNYLLDYENNNGAESVSIKDSTVLIADYAFNGENEITQIAMPDSVKYIGSYSFSQCGSLTSVTLSENTEDIGDHAFSYCYSLTSVTLSENIEEIGDYAFLGCPELKSITVPASVKTIGDDSLGYVGEDVRTPIDGFTIYGHRGTAARTYAKENGFKFVNLDADPSELELAEGSLATVDNDKKIIYILGLPTTYIWYLKSQFESELETDLDVNDLVTDGTTVKYGDTEYKVLVKGDIDGDGKVTAQDSRTVLKIASGVYNATEDEFAKADINSDGKVSAMEARSILRFCARLTLSIDESIDDKAEVSDDAQTPSVKFEYAFSGENELTCKFSIENNYNHLTDLLLIDIPDGLTLKDISSLKGPYTVWSELKDDNTIAMSAMSIESFDTDCTELATAYFELSDDVDMDNIVFHILDGSCVDDSIPLSGELKAETYSESFEYTENDDGTITITDFTPGTNSKGTLEIPSEIDGKTVTGIENYVLYGYYESVTIPDTVLSGLDDYTFARLKNLKDITVSENNPVYASTDGVLLNKDKTILLYCPYAKSGVFSIPDGVKKLNPYASVFANRNLITEIIIPSSFEGSDMDAFDFSNCFDLERITVDENNDFYSSSDDGVLFNKDKTILVCCPPKKAGSYAIPDGVKYLESYAFAGCELLTEISIPASVEREPYFQRYELNGTKFSNCRNLKNINVSADNEYYSSVDGVLYSKDKSILISCPRGKEIDTFTVPDTVKEIGTDAFFGNSNLTDIIVPDTITKIGYDAFGATGYYNDGDNWENECLYLDNYLLRYHDNNNVESVDIKDSTVLIADSAFYYTSVKKVNIPDSVKYIGEEAFSVCGSLEEITIPDSVISVGEEAFESCDSLKKVTLSNSMTSVEYRTFEYCPSLESITIPNSVTSIGEFAFRGCTSLKEIELSDSLVNIERYAFEDCSALETLNIPDSVSSIDGGAFDGCTALRKVKLSSSVTTVDDWFIGCPYLVSVIVPKEVTEIWGRSLGYYGEVKIDGFTIYGYKNTAAEKYANELGFTFVDLSECAHKNTVIKNAVSATCTTDGYTGDTYCNDCGQTIVYGKAIPAPGHKSEVVSGKSATCTESGLTDGTKCSVCGVTLIAQKTIPELGHKSEVINGKPATCTESGLTDGEKCSVCGVVIKDPTEIPAPGHKSEVIKGKPATCTESGLTDGEKCSVCGEIIKEQTEIPALGHKSEVINGKPAACTEKGLTDGEKCSVCGTVIKTQTEIPALGHKFENGVCTVCKSMDPDYKLVLNTDSKLLLDLDKKSITTLPVSVNGMTASELRKQFENEIDLGLDDGAPIANGTKFMFNGAEYIIIVKGDAQPDGKLTASDARAILRIAAKLDNPDDITKSAADINSDGKVTSAEARNILRFAARLANTIDG